MADQLPAVGEKVYAAGGDRITADAGKSNSIEAAKVKVVGGKSDFGIAVNWPVENRWVSTTDDVVKTAAITAYNLAYNPDNFYKYKLQFENTEHYDYYFSDQTGDSYEVNCFRNGIHNVEYDSDKPTIVFIKGS